MGDIILNVFSLVDKRLNRLKGLKMKSKSDLDIILPQYEKINEILNNAKKLLLKDPGDINYIQQNIMQIDIRLKIVESEKTIINNRIANREYDDDDSLTISTSFTSQSFLKPSLLNISTQTTTTTSTITKPTTTSSNNVDNNNNSNSSNHEEKKDVSSATVVEKQEIITKTLNEQHFPYENNSRPPSTYNPKDIVHSFKEEALKNIEEFEKSKALSPQCNSTTSEEPDTSVKLNENYNQHQQITSGNVEIKSGDSNVVVEINVENQETQKSLDSKSVENAVKVTEEDSFTLSFKSKNVNRQSMIIPTEEIKNQMELGKISENDISPRQPQPHPQQNISPQKTNSNNYIPNSIPHSPSFQSKLEIEEDKLNSTLMSSSLVDTFLLKYKGRSGSDLSISQFIQPFMIQSDSQIQQQQLPKPSSSVPYSSFFAKTSQQKISQKLKLAKHIQIRKVSDAKIGHARSNSQAKINYVPTEEEILLQQQHDYNPLSSSSPGKIMGMNNNNNNNNHKSLFLPTSSKEPYEPHLNSHSSYHINGNGNINSINNSQSNSNGNLENHIGQGERLALLQSLLKSEELTNNAERKVIDEINNRTRLKSQELYQLVWEVRHLDKAIAHILNNRLNISDLNGISFNDIKLNYNNNNNNGNNSNNSNNVKEKIKEKNNSKEKDSYRDGVRESPHITYHQKENGSAVIELSSSLKYSLERLVILLRTEPSILRDTLHRADYLGVEMEGSFKSSHTDLSQAIVFSLFGNCFTATDEKLLLLLIKSITELEFKMVKDKKSFGTQEPFSFTLVSTYLNYTYGKPYIISVLKDLVVSIIQDHNINLENDPEKKAMLAQIGILEEPEIDQHLLLQQFTGEFLKRTIALSSGIPYALRWLSKVIIIQWRNYLKSTRPDDFQPSEITIQKDKLVEREFIIHLLFENFFIPALIRPDHYGVLTGLTISHKARHNLIQIAKMVLDFIRVPSSIPPWIQSYFGDMDRVLDEYFTELIQVEEPETYYHRPIFELELGQDLLVSSTDLFIILELIYHNHPDPNIQQPDETTSLQKEVVEMIKKVQPASQLQEGMKFLVINVLPKFVDSTPTSNPKSLDPSVRLAKENLILALSVLSFLCGYSSSSNICELLLLQCGRSRSLELNILEAQIEETIRSLWALPEVYKQNDYQLLLDSMFDDYYKREKKRSLEKQIKVLYLDQLQRHTSQILSQKNISIEFLTNQKFRLFRDKIYARMQTEFVSDFMTQFSQHTGPCDCEPQLEVSVICKTCTLKSQAIKSFLTKSKNTLVQSEWWKSATDDDLNFASNTLERNLLTQIYNFTFNVSKNDKAFSKELNSKFSSIDHTHLYIPEKYSNQAPWELAQQELKKINLYKSPHDKMKCIIDTWNIIFNYTKPLGESGPDDFLPIMGYVIIKSRPENILSNIQYIHLYADLDDDHEIWFMNLKSSIEIVKEVLKDTKGNGWRRGILSLTSQRMENMLKEIKRKEKLKKYRTSIVRLESNSPILQQLQNPKNQPPTNINSQL
ncbi:RasGTPase-activating protein [Tieghemostelium lacteum]|uniref:RasGTPase-activating protein n=1 Tax=Tieghemostelium lacteum TaxID=361077 RepID=A0A152A2Q7_TIELA|nr:RasGTPase-activating protein [Tieghemostelium lacteum]|eukprot:KYR00489.1 RasGTPase-activating protein [Tieghemostelium lacteum]